MSLPFSSLFPQHFHENISIKRKNEFIGETNIWHVILRES